MFTAGQWKWSEEKAKLIMLKILGNISRTMPLERQMGSKKIDLR